MRRGPLLGLAVFLACTVGGYKLGLMRREARLQRAQEELERRVAVPEKPKTPIMPVAISTAALEGTLPSDVRRGGSVPMVLE